MKNSEKIIFFGNWALGVASLSKLLAIELPVVAVVTQHSSDSSDIYFNAVYDMALKHSIPVYTDYHQLPASIFSGCIGISIAFNKIFREDILMQLTIANFHPSPLPKYKGPSPIEWQLKRQERKVGMTAHLVDAGIDTGPIIAQDYFCVNYQNDYNEFLDQFNDYFSSFIATMAKKLLNETKPMSTEENSPGNYLPRINVPPPVKQLSLRSVSQYLNRKRIAVFTGNRAEFGILFPLLVELSDTYMIDLFVSGAHLIEPWMTITEVRAQITSYDLPINLIELQIRESGIYYLDVFQQLYPKINKHFLKQEECSFQYDLSICLGDRVETLVFAQASFFSKVPILHIFGGDVGNVPYFDTNIRHSISKISHLHFVSNEMSEKVLWQLGEERWRVKNIGNISLDYDRLGDLPSKEHLQKKYKIEDDRIVVIATHHASQFNSDESNLSDFLKFLTPLLELENCYVIITYPNNDPGGELIMEKIHSLEQDESAYLKVVPNLGTMNFHGILKHFRAIVVGNSSSGLMETSFFNTPAINIGDRQTDRSRGSNVYDTGLDEAEIRQMLQKIILSYDDIIADNQNSRYFFGNGTSALQAKKYIAEYLKLDTYQLINKRFVCFF